MVLPYLHKSRPALAPADAALRALAAQLRQDVEVLATDIGPRGGFAPDRYLLAEQFLTSALAPTGLLLRRLPFDSIHNIEAANLEFTLSGARHPDRILVLGAHYDSVPDCPAANDNASGVAGVLAVARALAAAHAARPLACTIRFVLFADEEPPAFNMNAMGSQIYARACRQAGDDIRGMVCLETIGCYSSAPGSQTWPLPALNWLLPVVGDFIALVGPSEARDFIKQSAEAFTRAQAFPLAAAAAPSTIDHINWSDHRGFNEAGYPAFMLTDTAPFRYPHYHQPTDTPEKLDYDSMARVISGVAAMLADLADQP